MKFNVAFDFDGVIHSYTSGWQGEAVVPDPPVPGIKECIANLRAMGYEVDVVSSRANSQAGAVAIVDYLEKHGIVVDRITDQKPPALVYVDDRAICFDGQAAGLVEKIINFRPWNAKETKT